MDKARRAALNEAMRKVSEGDRSAIEPLARELWPLVRAFCHRMLSASSNGAVQSDDIAQEVLIELFERSCEFDCEGDVLSWAFAIAAYRCRSERKKHKRSPIVPLTEEIGESDDPISSPESFLEANELKAAFEEAVKQLSPKDKEVLDAILKGLPLNAVLRKRKERMVVKLRRLFEGVFR
ncbi:MAG: sigma-70 family RNA polymerase sigma factor [Deltaproteobacteria bacterium]|nr:sigma-70 family RNA polymerase sigma factor [Deltaproteobacteria bacterium]